MSEHRFSLECENVQPELNAYVDGELEPAQHTAIERHLETCPTCRAAMELLKLVTGSLRLAPRPEPSEAMRQRLLAQVIAELPLHRMTVLCRERHGEQLVERREVRLLREPALPSHPALTSGPPIGLIVQRYRQESTHRSNCYQVVESHYGRNIND
jgi:hypothetical protein